MFAIKGPGYLENLLCRNWGNYKGLRTNNYKLLVVPRVSNKTFASRSFSVCGPSIWNKLPDSLRKIDDIDYFKNLKTNLFNEYFALNDTNDFIYY